MEQAIHSIKDKSDHLIIQEKGRTSSESAFICIRDGIYTGYGFIEKEIQINKFEDLETFIIPQKNTLETERIIQSFVARNPHKPRQFSKVMDSEHYWSVHINLLKFGLFGPNRKKEAILV